MFDHCQIRQLYRNYNVFRGRKSTNVHKLCEIPLGNSGVLAEREILRLCNIRRGRTAAARRTVTKTNSLPSTRLRAGFSKMYSVSGPRRNPMIVVFAGPAVPAAPLTSLRPLH